MTSGGLSAVDIGEPRSVGGIAREYSSRLVGSYGKTLNWDQPFKGNGGPATGGAYSIEPHVAERVFEELVREAGVTVLRDARLASVKKEGARIRELTTSRRQPSPLGARYRHDDNKSRSEEILKMWKLLSAK